MGRYLRAALLLLSKESDKCVNPVLVLVGVFAAWVPFNPERASL